MQEPVNVISFELSKVIFGAVQGYNLLAEMGLGRTSRQNCFCWDKIFSQISVSGRI